MTTAMQLFANEEFGEVRVIMRDGEPWFVAADVCRALELTNTTVVLERLDNDEKAKFNLGLSGGETNVINESGLYALVLTSRKPNAKKFRRWLTGEVVPSIRKTGGYSVHQQTQMTPLDAVNQVVEIAVKVQNFFAVKRGMALAQAIEFVETNSRLDMQGIKKLLPPAEHETGYLNATQIGERLGGIPPRTVNKMLAGKGMEYKVDGMWRLTEDGKEYGEEIPYTRNGHSGYQIRWSERVMELFGDEGATA